jgi:O-antigen/teichoic acid export membrane protein
LLLIAAPGELRRARGGRFELGRARRYAAFGVPVSLSLVMGVVYSGTDRLLIAAFIDEASVGAYHAGYGLADRTLDILFIWLGLAGAPAVIAALEREGPAAMRDAARTQAELMTLIALPAAAGLALVAQPLAEVMIGERLREPAARIIPWIAFSGLLAGFKAYYFDQAFTLAGRSSYLLWCMVIAAVLNVLLNLLLIPRLGLDGAVIATTLSIGAGLAASYGLGLRVLPLPIPWDTLARCGVAVAGMAGGLLTVPDIGGVPELVLKTVTGVLVYGVLALGLDAGGVRRRILDLSARLRRSAPATPRAQP